MGPGRYRFKTRRPEEAPDRRILALAMLEQEPSAGCQVRRRPGGDLPQVVEALGTRDERGRGLESEVGKVGVPLRDVGGIADDQLEALARERLEPSPMAEFDLQAKFRRVALGDNERRCACLDGDDPGNGAMLLDRQRQ